VLALVALVPTLVLGGILLWVLRSIERERFEAAKERARLLQRIQAPERAVVEHQRTVEIDEVPEQEILEAEDDDDQYGLVGTVQPGEMNSGG
jgi:hypothetical protein